MFYSDLVTFSDITTQDIVTCKDNSLKKTFFHYNDTPGRKLLNITALFFERGKGVILYIFFFDRLQIQKSF